MCRSPLLSSLLICRSFKTSAIERMRFAVKSLWPRAQVSDEHPSPADAVLMLCCAVR
jgi:hypothetical protein